MQLSIILRKTKVMPPPALYFYHIANEIPVSISKLFQLSSYVKIKKFLGHMYQLMRLKAK